MRRAWALSACIPFVAALSACGKRDRGDANATGSQAHTPATTPTPPPIDAPDLPAIDVSYQLPPASTVARRSAKPDAYVFVYGYGTIKVGPTPSLAAATEANDIESMRKLVPPNPAKAAAAPATDDAGVDTGSGTIGLGTIGALNGGGSGGTGEGYGLGGGGGTYVAYSLRGARTDPAAARIVLVADRQTSIVTIAMVVKALGEPVAVAVTGTPSDGALAMTLEAGSPTDGGRYLVTVSSLDTGIYDTNTGTDVKTVPNAELAKALDALDAAATMKIELYTRATFVDLIVGLDAAAHRTYPVPVSVRAGGGGMRGRHDAVPQIRIGQPNAVGDLDKAIIRRYIKRNIQKILYCYEKELTAKKDLEGSVTVEFVIGPDGRVPQAKATGMSNSVATCVAEVIHGIEFPKPTGGSVKVSYPFTFRPTGG